MVRICRAGDQLSIAVHRSVSSSRIQRLEGQGSDVFAFGDVRTFQDIQADTAQLVDVRVEDLGEEADLGRDHRVIVGEEELEFEGAAWSKV